MVPEHFTADIGEALVPRQGTHCAVGLNLHGILEKVALEGSEAQSCVIPPVVLCRPIHMPHAFKTLGLIEEALDVPEMLGP